MIRPFLTIALAPLLLHACAASPKTFYADPSSVKDTTLCRTFLDAARAGQNQFAHDTAVEAGRRGLTLEECQNKVNSENAVIAGVAVVAVGAAAVAACSGGGCGGYSSSQSSYAASTDYDCWGGGGDGPYFVRGPVQVGWNDPHDLDRDGDGVGCEPYGDLGA
jgi:hypothetical protein